MNAALSRLLPRWPGWRHLPRDTRDTLFQLAVIGWTLLPHASHLPAWCVALAGFILLWRTGLAVAGQPLPSRWVVLALLVLATALTLHGEGTLFGKEAGVTLLVVLVALKTLELRARRDALVVFFLGFFVVLTHFLYSQSLLVALHMLAAAWGLLTALLLAHLPVGKPPLWQAARQAGRAAVLGVPVMLALFLLFPRIGPLWGTPADAIGKTGLSGSLRLGEVAELALDDSIAMRVRFPDGNPPPPEAMYFRGPVLDAFDGRDWTRGQPSFPAPHRPRAELELAGAPVRYEATLEPSRLPLLPLLEITPDRPDSAPVVDGFVATQRDDLQWRLDRPLTERVRIEARAWPLHRHGPRTPLLGLRDLVELPPSYNPRTMAWAAELRARPGYREADGRTLAGVLMAHIRREGFSYTLEPGLYGRDAIDEFWLDRRAGFCEHFASAFVVVMRALDVPARIVTGYQGTDPVPVDGYYIVRQSHAHAWAEFWQEGEGWVRADPTAAVAPERVQRSRNLAPRPGVVANALSAVDPALLQRLKARWEALDNRWNQWVLHYSRGQQFDLLRRLGVASPSWHELAYALVGLLSAAALAGAGWALWDRQRQDPWLRLQRRVQQRLATLGVTVGPHEAPRARAARVRSALGDDGEPLAAALEALEPLRYGREGGRRVPRSWWARFAAAASAVTRHRPLPVRSI